jgi:hypothetical protein
LIDSSKVSSFQIGIFILCGVCLMLDGFDVQAIGYVARALFTEWHLPNSAGRVVSATLVGVLLGSILLSMLADKIGRRPVLIGATLYFSVLTVLTTQMTTLDSLRRRVIDQCEPEHCDPAATPTIRGECNELALRVTHAAVALYKGTALLSDHPAQRLAREALFLLVWSCPNPVIDCTIQILRGA